MIDGYSGNNNVKDSRTPPVSRVKQVTEIKELLMLEAVCFPCRNKIVQCKYDNNSSNNNVRPTQSESHAICLLIIITNSDLCIPAVRLSAGR
jgi:hypothetical protein